MSESSFPTDPKFILQWIEGIDDDIQRNSSSNPIPGTKFYIISNQWLSKWLMQVRGSASPLEIGPIDNIHLLDIDSNFWLTENEKILKKGLICKVDYELLPKKAWDALVNLYKCTDGSEIIKETVIFKGDDTVIEVSSLPLKIYFISLEGKVQSKILFVSYHMNIKDMYLKIKMLFYVNENIIVTEENLRVWQVDPALDNDEFERFLGSDNREMVGKILKPSFRRIDICGLADYDMIFAEVRHGMWIYKEIFFSDEVRSNGQEIFSSEDLKTRLKFDQSTFNTGEKVETYSKIKEKNGLVGLRNLGNTCYMNSGLQCLLNTVPLVKYILKGNYLNEINKKNSLGTQGNLISELAFIMRKIWYETYPSFVPTRFKSAFSNFAKQFSGFSQHDSQEFLSFLLDGLHEDLNQARPSEIPQALPIITSQMPLQEQADMSWKAHISRNRSFFVDTMHGQFKSTIVCPNGHVSLAFDPFLMISLPIPNYDTCYIKLLFIPKGYYDVLYECGMIGNLRTTVRDVKEYIGKIMNIDFENLKVAVGLVEFIIEGFLCDGDIVNGSNKYLVYEVVGENYVLLQQRKKKLYNSMLSGEAVGFTRVVCIESEMTCLQVHRAVYEIVAKLKAAPYTSFDQYLSFLNKDRPSAYTLNFVNTQFNKDQKQCPFCRTLNYHCPIPQTDEPFSLYTQRTQDKINIEMLWSHLTDERFYKTLYTIEKHNCAFEAEKFGEQLRKNGVALESCIGEFCKEERLDVRNKTFCKDCKEHVQGTKKMEIWRLPQILIFHLKRFKQIETYKIKDKKLVAFPIKDLDLSRFCNDAKGFYDLYAVSNHYGEKDFGHYTSYAFNYKKEMWYEFDDEDVKKINESRVVTPEAYVLFYKLKDN